MQVGKNPDFNLWYLHSSEIFDSKYSTPQTIKTISSFIDFIATLILRPRYHQYEVYIFDKKLVLKIIVNIIVYFGPQIPLYNSLGLSKHR